MPALAASYEPTQANGGVTSNALEVVGTGATYSSGHLNLPAGTYLSADAIGISLPTTSDPDTTQAPRSITVGFKGIVPQATVPLASLYHYSHGEFSLYGYWQDRKSTRLNSS